MRGKRGNRLFYMLIFDMLFIAALLFSLYSINERATNRAMDWHDIDTKNFGLLIDTLHAAPGDVEIAFSTQEQFISKLEPDRATIGKPLNIEELEGNFFNDDDFSWLSFGFGRSSAVSVEPGTAYTPSFMLLKQQDTISLSVENDQTISYDCPQADTAQEQVTFKVLGPSSAGDQEAFAKLTLITQLLSTQLVEEGFEESNSPNITIILGFHEEEQLLIEYGPETPEMEKFACLGNRFLSTLISEPVSYEPKTSAQKHIKIYFGTTESFEQYQNKREEIAQIITRWILHYYGT